MAQRANTTPITRPALRSRLTSARFARYGPWIWFGLVLFGLAVIPTVYSGLLVSSVKDPMGNLAKVPAAVVNLDQPADSPAGTIRLGEDLEEGLAATNPEASGNLGWRSMEEHQARAALQAGEVQAVMTIPAEFSANAAAVSTGEAVDAAASTLRVETNDGSGTVMGSIASAVGETAAATVAEGIGAEYVRHMLSGLTTVQDGMREAAEGAAQVSGGIGKAQTGADDLALGIDRLAGGSAAVSNGAERLAGGAATASSGSQDLAAGTAEVDAGAQRLFAGLSGIEQRIAALPDRSAELAEGAQQVAAGVGTLSGSVDQLETAAGTVAERIGPFAASVDEAVAGVQQVQDTTAAVAAGTAGLQGSTRDVAGGIEELLAGYDAMTENERKAALGELAADSRRLTAEADRAAEGAAATEVNVGGLVGDAASGTGLAALQDGTRQVADGAREALAGISGATASIRTLAAGAGQVAAGTQALAAESDTLVDGLGQARAGAGALAAGTAELDDGAGQLAARLPELAARAAELEAGSAELSTGLATAYDGSRQIAAGLGTVAGRSGDLADALREGAEQVPVYSDPDITQLASVVAAPVDVRAERINEVPASGYSMAAYFMALALWVGALGYFLTRPALHTGSLNRGRPMVEVTLRSIALPAIISVVQSLLMVAAVIVVLDGQVANGWGLAGMALLTSLTFFAINQAIMALFGPPGQFIAPLMMVVQLSASGGMYPVETAPAFFQAIHPWLPMSYALESFRSLIAGGSIGIADGVPVMLAYLAISGVLMIAAVWLRGRAVRRPAHAAPVVSDMADAQLKSGSVKPDALAAR